MKIQTSGIKSALYIVRPKKKRGRIPGLTADDLFNKFIVMIIVTD